MNQSKIDTFSNEISLDYDKKRRELGVKDNFYFNISGLTENGNSVAYLGNMPGSGNKNSIKIERIVVYNNKLTKFELYVWR